MFKEMSDKIQLKDLKTQSNVYPVTSVEYVVGIDEKITELNSTEVELNKQQQEDIDSLKETKADKSWVEERLENISSGEGGSYDDTEVREKISALEKIVNSSVHPEPGQIIYTTYDDKPIVPINSGYFDDGWEEFDNVLSLIESNEYYPNKGYGILTLKDKIKISPFVIYGQHNLKSVTVSGAFETIEGYAICNNPNLVEINIEDGVKRIGYKDSWDTNGYGTFTSNTSLRDIILPDSITELGPQLFYLCKSLLTCRLPKNIEYIPTAMFDSCSSLLHVEIPTKVKVVWGGAFKKCSSLVSVYIPESVTQLGSGCFMGCTSLISANLNKVTILGNGNYDDLDDSVFAGCESLKELVIPNGVKGLSNTCGSYNWIMDRLVIPSSVTSIKLFWQCTPRVIDTGTTFINTLFPSPRRLEELILRSTSVVTGVDTYFNTTRNEHASYPYNKNLILANLVIRVPVNLLEQYKTTYPDFANRFHPIYGEDNVYAYQNDTYTKQEIDDIKGDIDEKLKAIKIEPGQIIYTTYDDEKISITDRGSGWNDTPYSGVLSNVKSNEYYANKGFGIITVKDNTTVPEYLLYKQSKLKTVTIPGTFKTISQCAVAENPNIKELNIEDGVQTLLSGAIRANGSITNIIFPDSITEIGDWAIERNYNLIYCKLPNNLKKINEGLFYHCNSLLTIDIPDSVTTIGDEAFNSCNLFSVVLGKGVKTIGDGVFGQNINLSKINDSGVTTFGNDVYYKTNIQDYEYPDGLTKITKWVFTFALLNSITIPASVTSFDGTPWEFYPKKIDSASSFSNAYRWPHPSRLEELILRHNGVIGALDTWLFENPWIGNDNQKSIPYNNVPLEKLKIYVPANLVESYKTKYPKLAHKIFPINGEQSVYAFQDNTYTKQEVDDKLNLTLSIKPGQIIYTTYDDNKVNLTHESIVSNEYYPSKGYGIVTLNDTENVPDKLFYNIDTLKTVTVPGTFKHLNGQPISHNFNLKELILENGIETIDSLDYNTSLRDIVFPDSVTTLGDGCLSACTSLLTVKLPKNLKVISAWCFDVCSSLLNVQIPSSVTTIKQYAFEECTSLTSIELPDSCKTIESDAFYGCTNLQYVNLNKLTGTFENILYNCTSIRELRIPETITTIGDNGGANLNLDVLVIPSSVNSIKVAFYRTKVRKLDYGSSVNFTTINLPWPKELEELIIRYEGGVLTGLESYLKTTAQGIANDGVMLSKFKIYVAPTLVDSYKTTYPNLAYRFHPITGEDNGNTISIVQSTGSSDKDVMSQKSVTDELKKLDEKIENIDTPIYELKLDPSEIFNQQGNLDPHLSRLLNTKEELVEIWEALLKDMDRSRVIVTLNITGNSEYEGTKVSGRDITILRDENNISIIGYIFIGDEDYNICIVLGEQGLQNINFFSMVQRITSYVDSNFIMKYNIWKGTKTEYDAIESKNENILYFIVEEPVATTLELPVGDNFIMDIPTKETEA